MSDYNMSGRLFKNDRKTAGSNQPDFRGDATIEGIAFVISGWVKPSKTGGSDWVSIKYERKEDADARRGQGQQQRPYSKPNRNDNIPF